MRTIVVTTLDDTVYDTAAGNPITLRRAIENASNTAGDHRIVFHPSLAGGTISLDAALGILQYTQNHESSGNLIIDGDITGNGQPDITVDGQGATDIFFFNNLPAADDNLSVTINGLNVVGAQGNSGAIGSFGNLNITNSVFRNNASVSAGGAVRQLNGHLSVVGSTFESNQAVGAGGAIAALGSATLEISKSTINNNIATIGQPDDFLFPSQGMGGGIYAHTGATISNSTIVDNIAATHGGGIASNSAVSPGVHVRQSTITGNSVGSHSSPGGAGGGIYVIDNPGAVLTVENSIVSLNNAGTDENIASGPYDVVSSIIDSGDTSLFERINPETGGGLLADHGGLTKTVALRAFGSIFNPAIDGASPSLAISAAQNGEAFDGNGDGEIKRDIGAYEVMSVVGSGALVVTTAADVVDDTDGVLSLREAIELVNRGGQDRRIIFDPSLLGQTIRLELGELVITNTMTIDGDITGNGRADITIDAQQKSRVLNIDHPHVNVNIHSLHITGGKTRPITPVSGLDYETQAYGGAIRNTGRLILSESTVSNSTGYLQGGAIYNGPDSQLYIRQSSLENNQVWSLTGDGSVDVTSDDTGDAALRGGAIIANYGYTHMSSSTVVNNTSDADGGAVLNASAGELVSDRNTITGNESAGGTTIFGGSGSVRRTIIVGNRDHNGQVLNDSLDSNHYFVADNLLNVDANLVFASVDPVTGGGMAGDNGGVNRTVALNPVSSNPALDKLRWVIPTVDSRGFSSFDSDGDGLNQRDIGAFELQTAVSTLLVTTADDVVDAEDGVTSLREALDFINKGLLQGTITFDPSLAGETIVLTQGELVIGNNVVIDAEIVGNGTSGIIIDGADNSRVFLVDDGDDNGVKKDVTLKGLTIIGGKASDGAGSHAGEGGGLLNRENLTLINTTFALNSAQGNGAALANLGDLHVESSLFAENATETQSGSGIVNYGNATVINSTFTSNTAGQKGAGIFNAQTGVLTLDNSTMTGNSADVSGGGAFNDGGVFTVNNAIVTGNVSPQNKDINSSLTINNSLISTDPALVFAAIDTSTGGGLLADNGGPTLSVALNPDANNPALDSANGSGTNTDQLGTLPYDADVNGTSIRDIGAFELQSDAVTYQQRTISVNNQSLVVEYSPGTQNYRLTASDNERVIVPTTAAVKELVFVPNGNTGMIWVLNDSGDVDVIAIDSELGPDQASAISIMSMLSAGSASYAAMTQQGDNTMYLLDNLGYLHRFDLNAELLSFAKTAEPLFDAGVLATMQPVSLSLLASGEFEVTSEGNAPLRANSPMTDAAEVDKLFGIKRLAGGDVIRAQDGNLFKLDNSQQWQVQDIGNTHSLEYTPDGAVAIKGTDSVTLFSANGTASDVHFTLDNSHILSAGNSNGTTFVLDTRSTIHFSGALNGTLDSGDIVLSDIAVANDAIWALTDSGDLIKYNLPTSGGNGQNMVGTVVNAGRAFYEISIAANGGIDLKEFANQATHHTQYDPQFDTFTATVSTNAPGIFDVNFHEANGVHLTEDGRAFTLIDGKLYAYSTTIEDWVELAPSDLRLIKVGADGELYGLCGDNAVVALNEYGGIEASDVLNESGDTWLAQGITTSGYISDFSVDADGNVRIVDQDNQLRVIGANEDWTGTLYGDNTEADGAVSPYAAGTQLTLADGTVIEVMDSAELPTGERMIITTDEQVLLGVPDVVIPSRDDFVQDVVDDLLDIEYDFTFQRWPGSTIFSVTASKDGVFMVVAETLQGTPVTQAFIGDWVEYKNPVQDSQPNLQTGEVITSHAIDSNKVGWLLTENGNQSTLYKRLNDNAPWVAVDTGGRTLSKVILNGQGTVAFVDDNGKLVLPEAGSADTFSLIPWDWSEDLKPTEETKFAADFKNLALGARWFSYKTELLGHKHKGKFVGSGMGFFQWFRTHVVNGVVYDHTRKRDAYHFTSQAQQKYNQLFSDMSRNAYIENLALDFTTAKYTEFKTRIDSAGISTDILKTLERLELMLGTDEQGWNDSATLTAMDNYKNRHPGVTNKLAQLRDVALNYLGAQNEITQKLNNLVEQKNVFITPAIEANYKALFGQLALDLVTVAQVAEQFDEGFAGDSQEVNEVIEARNSNKLHDTRKTGLLTLDGTGNIYKSFDYFSQVLQRPHHKASRQLRALNITSADQLKNKLSSMVAGDTIEISSDFYHGGDARVNGGTTFFNPLKSFIGFTAYLSAGNSYSYSIGFTRLANGNIEVSLGRNKAFTVEGGLDTYSDVTDLFDVTQKNRHASIYPEFDLSIDAARTRGTRDGINFTLDQSVLQTGTQPEDGNFLDQLFSGNLDISETLSNVNGISSSHKDVVKTTLDVSAEVSMLPYKGHTKQSDVVAGSAYMFLPGIGLEGDVTLYQSEQAESFDPNNTETRNIKKFSASWTNASLSYYFRLGGNNRWRVGGATEHAPVGNAAQNGDVQTIGFGYPIYTKAALKHARKITSSLKGTKHRNQQRLIPTNSAFKVESDNTGKITKVSWSVSHNRDVTLVKNPAIQQMLNNIVDEGQRAALLEDITRLASFTTPENRAVFATRVQELSDYINSAEFSGTEEERTAASLLIEDMNRHKDFTFGGVELRDNLWTKESDRALFSSALEQLFELDAATVQIAGDLRSRLDDSKLWATPNTRSDSVSVSVQLNQDGITALNAALGTDGMDGVQRKMHELFKGEQGNIFNVTGISATESRTRNTRFEAFALYRVKSAATGALSRKVASLSINYGDNQQATYDSSKTSGFLFDTNPTEANIAPVANGNVQQNIATLTTLTPNEATLSSLADSFRQDYLLQQIERSDLFVRIDEEMEALKGRVIANLPPPVDAMMVNYVSNFFDDFYNTFLSDTLNQGSSSTLEDMKNLFRDSYESFKVDLTDLFDVAPGVFTQQDVIDQLAINYGDEFFQINKGYYLEFDYGANDAPDFQKLIILTESEAIVQNQNGDFVTVPDAILHRLYSEQDFVGFGNDDITSSGATLYAPDGGFTESERAILAGLPAYQPRVLNRDSRFPPSDSTLDIIHALRSGMVTMEALTPKERAALYGFFPDDNNRAEFDRQLVRQIVTDEREYNRFIVDYAMFQAAPGTPDGSLLPRDIIEEITAQQERAIHARELGGFSLLIANSQPILPGYLNNADVLARMLLTFSDGDESILQSMQRFDDMALLSEGEPGYTETTLQQRRTFAQLLQDIGLSMVAEEQNVTDLAGAFNLLQDNNDQYLQLVSGEHAFAIGRRTIQDNDGNTVSQFYFVDPTVDINSQIAVGTKAELQTLVQTHFDQRAINGEWQGSLATSYNLESNDAGLVFTVSAPTVDNDKVALLTDFASSFKSERERLAALGNVNVGGQSISLATLFDMGATINGHYLHADMDFTPSTLAGIQFDADGLNDYLQNPSDTRHISADRENALRMLRQQMENRGEMASLLTGPPNGQSEKLLGLINTYVNLDGTIDPVLGPQLTEAANKVSVDYLNTFNQSAWSRQADNLSFGVGTIQSVIALSNFFRRKASNELISKQERIDAAILGTGLGLELSSSVIERGMVALALRIDKAVSGLASSAGKSMAQFASRALTRASGTLSILTAGFDIYGAVVAFREWSKEDDFDRRQDLAVAGGLSIAGAAVGIGVGVALLAGSALALTTGIGALAGLALLLGGGIYSGVRAVRELEKTIDLTVSEKWKTGWRTFWGLGPSGSVRRKIAEVQQQQFNVARDSAIHSLHNSMKGGILEMMANDNDPSSPGRMGGAVFTKTGGIDFVEKNFLYIEFKNSSGTVINDPQDSFRNIKQHELDDRLAVAQSFAENNNLTYEVRTQDEKYYHVDEVYDGNEVYDSANMDLIGDSTPAESELTDLGYDIGTLDLTTLDFSEGRDDTWSQIIRHDLDHENDFILYTLGGGSDFVRAQADIKAVFSMHGGGEKTFYGSQKDDSFLLYSADADEVTAEGDVIETGVSMLDGNDGVDTFIVDGVFGEGNQIVLNSSLYTDIAGPAFADEAALSQASDYQDFYLIEIENVMGAEDGKDTITGNDLANVIDGRGGSDVIYAGEGDDVITMHRLDVVNGESGNDVYVYRPRVVDPESGETPPVVDGTIVINEVISENDINTILLDYDINSVSEAYLIDDGNGFSVGFDIQEEDGSKTTLVLTEMYDANGKRLDKHFSVNTKDGFMLIPQFTFDLEMPETEGETPTGFEGSFSARYVASADRTLGEEFDYDNVSLNIDVPNNTMTRTADTAVTYNLPTHFYLVQEGNGADDVIVGSDKSEMFRGYAGNDDIKGGDGDDVYVININYDEVNNSDLTPADFVVTDTGEKLIRNYEEGTLVTDEDNNPVLDEDGNEVRTFGDDYLVFNADRSDIGIRQDGDDVIIYFIPDEERVAKVRIRKYMRSEYFRHLTLMDADGTMWTMGVDDDGNPFIGDTGIYGGSEDADVIESTDMSVWAFTGGGDDELIAKTYVDAEGNHAGGDVLDGGAGDDSFSDSDGDNAFIGGLGDDVFTLAGGTDSILTGEGRNTIDLTDASGLKLIASDTLNWNLSIVELPFDFTVPNVVFVRDGDDLIVHPPLSDSDTGGQNDDLVIIFAGYFISSANQNINLKHRSKIWNSADLYQRATYNEQTELDDIIYLTEQNFTEVSSGVQQFDALDGHDMIVDVLEQQDGVTHRLLGGNGIDRIYGGDGTDEIWGGNGHDELFGDAGDDVIEGEAGNDLLVDLEGINTLNGGLGDDELYGQGTLIGGAGVDVITAGDGNDILYGDTATSFGNDGNTLFGMGGNDQIHGDNGNDTINAGAGDDVVFAYGGDDTVFVSTGSDAYHGGDGQDTLSFEGMDDGITADFAQNQFYVPVSYGVATNIQTVTGFESVMGTEYGDALTAGNGVLTLFGGGGADTLVSDADQTYLAGGEHNDVYEVILGDGDHVTIAEVHGTSDQLRLSHRTSSSVTPDDVWFEQVGDDLVITLRNPDNGLDATVLVEGYFFNTASFENVFSNDPLATEPGIVDYRIEEIVLNGSFQLSHTDISALVADTAGLQPFSLSVVANDGQLTQQKVNSAWTLSSQPESGASELISGGVGPQVFTTDKYNVSTDTSEEAALRQEIQMSFANMPPSDGGTKIEAETFGIDPRPMFGVPEATDSGVSASENTMSTTDETTAGHQVMSVDIDLLVANMSIHNAWASDGVTPKDRWIFNGSDKYWLVP